MVPRKSWWCKWTTVGQPVSSRQLGLVRMLAPLGQLRKIGLLELGAPMEQLRKLGLLELGEPMEPGAPLEPHSFVGWQLEQPW